MRDVARDMSELRQRAMMRHVTAHYTLMLFMPCPRHDMPPDTPRRCCSCRLLMMLRYAIVAATAAAMLATSMPLLLLLTSGFRRC